MHNIIIRLLSEDGDEGYVMMRVAPLSLLSFYICITFFRLSNSIMRYHINVSLMPGRAHHCAGDSTEKEKCAQGTVTHGLF